MNLIFALSDNCQKKKAMDFDPKILDDIANMPMPFGKHKGTRLSRLPEPYLTWFKQVGFPKGRLGLLLETLYEIKLNGLEYLLRPLERS